MRGLLIISFFIVTLGSAFAQLSDAGQRTLVENIAKKDRQNMWRMGMNDVSSNVHTPTKTQIDEIVRNNKEVESPLSKDEIAAIYRCFHSNCVVYTIDLSGEMFGGFGVSRRWVFVYPQSGKHFSFLHEVYSE